MSAAGADVALETADVVLMSDDLGKIATVVNLSRRARRVIWQNIAFALGVIVVLVASNFLTGVCPSASSATRAARWSSWRMGCGCAGRAELIAGLSGLCYNQLDASNTSRGRVFA